MHNRLLVLLGLFLCVASASQAQNLVTNPGFETSDFTGWIVTGTNTSVDTGVAHTGIYAGAFGADASNGEIDELSQALATQTGQKYLLNFFAQTPQFNNFPGSPNALSVYFGSNLIAGPFTVPDDTGPRGGAPHYLQYSYVVTATSNSTALRFLVSNDSDFTQLDDISVTAVAVPEPGNVALVVGMSLTGAAFLKRRKSAGKPV